MTKNSWNNSEQDLKELLNGINIGQKWLIRLKITFTKANRLLVLSFENENDRTSFSKYYVSNVQINDFNVLINGKSFFDISIKNGKETYKQIIEMGRNNDYTTGNSLDYEYFSKHYELIATDLSK